MRNVRIWIMSLLVTGCFIGLASAGYSQGTNLGTIRGSVSDPNGAVLPNAAVKVTDQTTGLSRDVTTDNEGNYEVAALKPGPYKVAVSASGFKSVEVDVIVKGSDVVRADVKAELGAQNVSI